MWKLIVLLALAATANGEDYVDRLTISMNEAVNGRCGSSSTDDYSEACSELLSGYDYNTLRKQYDEASTVVGGLCIYELTRVHEGESQTTSVGALMLILSQLLMVARDLRSQFYNLINLDNNDQVRYLIPKIADEDSETREDFISTIEIGVNIDSKNEYADNFKTCFNELVNGETNILDYSNAEEAATALNTWFFEKSSDYKEIATAKDLRYATGFIYTSFHNVEVTFEGFAFTDEQDIDYYTEVDVTKSTTAWVGTGLAKIYYSEKYGATAIQVPLKGNASMLIVKPEVGRLTDLLFNLRDNRVLASLIPESDFEYTKLYIPLADDIYGSEDYVGGLKLANQLTPIYDSDFDGFQGILKDASGHVSHLYHKMHLKINRVDELATSTSESSDSAQEVVINNDYVFYILSPTGTPVLTVTRLL